MNILKQSTAATIKLGPFVDDTDGKSAETGLTISQADIRLSKNGGDIAQSHNTAGATHDELGYYNVPLDATDTGTLGRLLVAVHESGALPVWQEFMVVTANVYDTLCSTDTFDVNVTSLADDVITAGKFDESTAYPLKSADTGATQVARVGADSDTLETLSDQLDAAATASALSTLDGKIDTIDSNVDAVLADTGTDGVVLAGTQGAITWGQQKIVADVEGEGALDIKNTNDNGFGKMSLGGYVGELNAGVAVAGVYNVSNEGAGVENEGNTYGVRNIGVSFGMYNKATGVDGIGLKNVGEAQNVEGFDPAQATEATLAAIKAKTDNLPASPAAVGSAMTLTTAYDKAKDDVLTPLGVVDGIVDAIKVQTDKIPATPASAGEYTTNIGAIKAKTDNLPLSPASSGEYTSALTAIQADLDNPNQYKADVSNLATTAHVQEVEDKVDIVDGIADAILDDTGTTGVLLSTSALTSIFDDEVIVGSYNFSDLLKIMASALAGKLSGGGTTTLTFRGVDDTSDVIVATVDANGNRSALTLTV